jgi:hypothetical protein
VEAFPFTEAEWAAVSEAALPVVNATLADDAVLRASHLVELLDVLARLRSRHGNHSVLLETEADFVEDEAERLALYQRAVSIAVAHGLPTLSIRLSLAGLLLEMGQQGAARAELLACEGELCDGDDSERASWTELVAQASSPEQDAAAVRPRD